MIYYLTKLSSTELDLLNGFLFFFLIFPIVFITTLLVTYGNK